MKFFQFIVLIFIFAITGCNNRPTNNTYIEETLILSLSSTEGVTTLNEYSGWVTLTFSGVGYIDDVIQTDALFAFRDNNYLIPDTEIITQWGIIVDEYVLCCEIYQHPPFIAFPKTFNPEHIYIFEYYVDSSRQKINFRSGDTTYSDNHGEIQIHVTTEPVFIGR